LKIGLVGTLNNSGLGQMAKAFQKHIGVHIQLLVKHPKKGTHEKDALGHFIYGSWPPTRDEIDKFLSYRPDVVVFFESCYNHKFPKILKEHKIPCIIVPMIDQAGVKAFEDKGIAKDFTLYWSPTKVCHEAFVRAGYPSKYIPWPIDTNKFKFKQRGENKIITFVHNTGFVGSGNRKAPDITLNAWKKVRQVVKCKLIMRSQIDVKGDLQGVDFRKGDVKHSQELYQEGDVYLMPHRKDGLGLPMYEAMACGMLVLSPNAPPWNEINTNPNFCLKLKNLKKFTGLQDGFHCTVDADDLANKMISIVKGDVDICKQSRMVSKYVQQFSWETIGPTISQMLKGIV